MEVVSDETHSGCINSPVMNWCIYAIVSFILDLFKYEVILSFGVNRYRWMNRNDLSFQRSICSKLLSLIPRLGWDEFTDRSPGSSSSKFVTLLFPGYLSTVSNRGAWVLNERRCELSCIYSGICIYQQGTQSHLSVHLSSVNAE